MLIFTKYKAIHVRCCSCCESLFAPWLLLGWLSNCKLDRNTASKAASVSAPRFGRFFAIGVNCRRLLMIRFLVIDNWACPWHNTPQIIVCNCSNDKNLGRGPGSTMVLTQLENAIHSVDGYILQYPTPIGIISDVYGCTCMHNMYQHVQYM